MTAVTVSQLWVYPVKSCQGIQLKSVALSECGFEYDRAWCVVDFDGNRYRAREQLSQRKLPLLASIGTRFTDDGRHLVMNAPDMPDLVVPVAEEAYERNEEILVECGGLSTTSSGGWQLGRMKGRSAGKEASDWLSRYLNRVDANKQSKPASRYDLVRSIKTDIRAMSRYAGAQQVPFKDCIEEQSEMSASPFQMQSVDVQPGDAVRFADFGSFLLVSEDSHADLVSRMGVSSYPIAPFRPNIIVQGAGVPWVEETWRRFTIGQTPFRVLKNAPRCTIPSRDQMTGAINAEVAAKPNLPQATLRRAFPAKCTDDEWGREWEGPCYGVFVAHGGLPGKLHQGDRVQILSSACGSWHCNLASKWKTVLLLLSVLASLAALRRRPSPRWQRLLLLPALAAGLSRALPRRTR